MTTPAPSPLASLRVTATALVTAPLVILLAVYFVLPGDDGVPPLWAWGALALDAVIVAVIVTTVGYRTPAIAPGTPEDEAAKVSLSALTSTTILRCALTESVAIICLALAFVVSEGGLLLYVVGAMTSVALSILLSWPSDRIVAKVRDSLEREGGRSYLL